MMLARVSQLTPKQLRDWRDRLGISKHEAAALIGASVRSYILYENGQAAISKPIALACYLIEAKAKEKQGLTHSEQPTYLELKQCLDDLLKGL